MTDDELFEMIGHEIALSQRMGTSITPEQKRELGRGWLSRNIGKLREKICGDKAIEDLASKGDTIPLVAALTPLLGLQSTVVSTATIAVIIARIGLRRFCASDWTKKS